LSMIYMRLLSFAMMLFMFGSMTATRREQQRRWMAMNGYALHGYDEYGTPLRHGSLQSGYMADHHYYQGVGGVGHGDRVVDEEAFWSEFEAGRRGRLEPAEAQGRTSLLLQVLALDQMLLRMRQGGSEYDEEEEGEEEYEEEEGEEGDWEGGARQQGSCGGGADSDGGDTQRGGARGS